MSRFILHRLLSLIPTVLGISLLVFLMVQLVPGDPAEMMLGERASEQAIQDLRQQLGLDQPLYIQYGMFLSRLVRGDLGRALRTNEKITVEIAENVRVRVVKGTLSEVRSKSEPVPANTNSPS